MKIALIGSEIEENLSLRYISSYLRKKGHTVKIISFSGTDSFEKAVRDILDFSPELVGLSMVFQSRAVEFMNLAVRLREEGYRGHITCGGHFPTFSYREILKDCPAIDSVVRHEGEEAMGELAEALCSKRDFREVRGFVYHSESELSQEDELIVNTPGKLREDLDSLPFPSRDYTAPLNLGIPTASIIGSRGCYGNCTFCCINAWNKSAGGPKWRKRSMENITDEMAELYHNRGTGIFIFHDDNFFSPDSGENHRRISRMKELMKEKGLEDIGIVIKARPNDIDRDIFQTLKEMGLVRVYLGIENNSPSGLKHLNRMITPGQNERAIEILKDLDIFACYNILLFEPLATPGDIEQNIRFMEKYNYYPFNFGRTESYIASPLQDWLREKGRLLGNYIAHDYEILHPKVEGLFRIIASAFRERNFTLDGIVNRNMGLAYIIHILKKFYPEAYSEDLRRRVDCLVKEINQTGIDYLKKAFHFVMRDTPLTIGDMQSFTAQLAFEIIASNYSQMKRLENMEMEIRERAFYRQHARKDVSGYKPCLNTESFKNIPVGSILKSLTAASVMTTLALAMNAGLLQTFNHVSLPKVISPVFAADQSDSPLEPVKSKSHQIKFNFLEQKCSWGSVSSVLECTATLDVPGARAIGKPTVVSPFRELKYRISPDMKRIYLMFYAREDSQGIKGTARFKFIFPVEIQKNGKTMRKEISRELPIFLYDSDSLSIGEKPLSPEHRSMMVDPVSSPSYVISAEYPIRVNCPIFKDLRYNQEPGKIIMDMDMGEIFMRAELKPGIKGKVLKPKVSVNLGKIKNMSADKISVYNEKSGKSELSDGVTFLYMPPFRDKVLVPGKGRLTIIIPVESGGKVHNFKKVINFEIRPDGRIVFPKSSYSDYGLMLQSDFLPSQSRYKIKSLPRTLWGQIERIGNGSKVKNEVLLKLVYDYRGLKQESKEAERVSHCEFITFDGVRIQWSSSSGKIVAIDETTARWIPPPNSGTEYCLCECRGPDGSVMVHSYGV